MGKILNFSLLYGMSKHTLYYTLMDFGVNLEDKELQKQYGVYSGQDLANKLYDSYFDSYTGVEKFMENQRRKVREKEYAVTLAGRKIWIPEINSSSRKYRSYGERLASNSIIQGSANDIIMAAQVRVENSQELKELNVDQLMQVHDEILFQVPKKNVDKAIPIIKELMENPFEGKIPLNLKMEADWGRGKDYFEAK